MVGMHKQYAGFTLVELLIILVVLAIIAAVSIMAFGGMRQRAVVTMLHSDLSKAAELIEIEMVRSRATPTGLPVEFRSSEGVTVTMGDTSPRYSGLTPVQNGVLLHKACVDTMANPDFTTIHGADGIQTATVQLNCNDNVAGSSIQITAWQSTTWLVPIHRAAIEIYMAGVPADSWWIDRQAVVRGFYQRVIDQFEAQGGMWPVTSFWDSWANQWSGIPYEALPDLGEADSSDAFCIEAVHESYPDMIYHATPDSGGAQEGSCT